jgi:predicted TIM-barrel fold metal-dependent hydrolase
VNERGVPDLIVRTRAGRLTVVELKAQEDMQFAMQGLDYWMRVRHLHMSGEAATGAASEFTKMGYFSGQHLTREDPLLILAAPALRIHPAVEVVLRHFSARVPWQLIAVDERWRREVRVVWRKRSSDR